jgi:internalin A
LRDFHDLKTLDLSAQNISDISAIRNNTQLEILRLSRNNISEISPLMELTNLKELAL